MIGINDFLHGVHVSTVAENYHQIIKNILDSGMDVYIISTIIAGPKFKNLNQNILELNKLLEKFSSTLANVTYIEINDQLSRDGLLIPDYTFDDVHLNGEGLIIFKRIIAQYL